MTRHAGSRVGLALTAVVATVSLAAWLLVSACAAGGGMGASERTCRCAGIEWQLHDARPADGPHRTVCLGIVRGRTCYQTTGGPAMDCPPDP